jgi:hypothetical protein
LDWIFFSSIQSKSNENPVIQQKSKNLTFWIFDIESGLNIQLFWIFGVGFGWMFNHPFNPKSRKKLTSLILNETKKCYYLKQHLTIFNNNRSIASLSSMITPEFISNIERTFLSPYFSKLSKQEKEQSTTPILEDFDSEIAVYMVIENPTLINIKINQLIFRITKTGSSAKNKAV